MLMLLLNQPLRYAIVHVCVHGERDREREGGRESYNVQPLNMQNCACVCIERARERREIELICTLTKSVYSIEIKVEKNLLC